MTLYKFVVDISENLPTLETVPVFFEDRLVGSMVRTIGDSASGFVALAGTPLLLKIDINEPFYVTPRFNNRGIVIGCDMSELSVGVRSRPIRYATPYLLEGEAL